MIPHDYFELRAMGHGRIESLKRIADYYFTNLLPIPYTKYDEFRAEDDLRFLEQCSEPDFQSIEDIVNLHVDSGTPYPAGYRTKEQLCLVYLQSVYNNNKDLLSMNQIQRYENILKQLPPKFEELVDAAMSRDKLKEYEGKIKRETQKKIDEWKQLNNQ